MPTDDRPRIQRADARERRRFLWWLALSILPVAALSAWYPQILQWATADPARGVARLNGLIATLLIPASVLVVASLSLWRSGRDSVRARRFPPPGSKVIRDTVIIEGLAAIRRGRQLQWVAALLIFCALLPPPVLWWLVWRIAGPGAGG